MGDGNPVTYVQQFKSDDLAMAAHSKNSIFKFIDGRTLPVSWSFKSNDLDEYTMEPLPQRHIEEAIIDELSYFNEHVWLGVSLQEAKNDPNGKILSG